MSTFAWSSRSEARAVLAGLLLRGGALAVEKASRMVLVIGAAPALGEVGFGRYQFALTVTGLLALFADLGLSVWTTRALARDPDRRPAVVRVGLRLRALAAVPFLLAVAISVAVTPAGDARTTLAWLGVAALANAFLDYFAAILRGYEQWSDEARLNVVRALTVTVAGLAALHLGRSVTALATGLAVGTIVCALGGLVLLARRTGAFSRAAPAGADPRLARAALTEAAPIWLATLLSLVYFKLDVVVLRGFSGEAEVGLYGAAYKILEATMILPSVLMATAFSPLARIGQDRARRRRWEITLAAALLLTGAVVGGAISLSSDGLVGLLFGGAFAASATSVRILAFAVPPMFLNAGLIQFLIARGLEWRNFVLSALLVAVNLGLNLALVPRFAGRGAAVATALTELALAVGCVAILRFHRPT